MKPIVIIHGWSDNSDSFQNLAKRLKRETGRPVEEVWLSDYVSMDNDVKLADIAIAMQRAWEAKHMPILPNSIDAIIHSTGGLVIRLWMQRFYTDKGLNPPIQNLVMLAPANFGSPLAHKGRSLIGRVVKGHNSKKRFQTGTHVLKGLEMASPFTWDLAQHDRFTTNAFSDGGVLCTVIVGNFGYPGIKGIANELGSDGTVYVSTANLNCAKLKIEVDAETGDINPSPIESSVGKTAFHLLDRFDHGSITGKNSLPKKLLQPILESLEVTQDNFEHWCDKCADHSQAVSEKYARRRDNDQHSFQNMVFRVMDSEGDYVEDYTIEFYGKFDEEEDQWAHKFNRYINTKVHAYKDNNGYRSFLINTTRLFKEVDKINESLRISISALPDLSEDNVLAGYQTFGQNDAGEDVIGQIELNTDQLKAYFQHNRTLLVDILLPRHQKDEVFNLNKV